MALRLAACREDEAAARHRPGRLQSVQERCDAGLAYRMIFGERHKHTDASHPLGLLCARRERPRRRAHTGCAARWARAASGQATAAAPLSSVMNSRLFIQSLRRR
jgi:hypothetical protein